MRQIILSGIITVLGCSNLLFSDQTDKEKVDSRLSEFTEAFNQANSKTIGTLLTEKATLTSPFVGKPLTGKTEVTQFFEKGFPLFKGKKLVFIEKSVDFPTAEKATVQGVSELTDNGNVVLQQARKVELVKQNGTWYIDSIREIELQPAPDMYSHLKEIEWLVGNWHDVDQNVSIIYDTKWDKFKNFLIQHFTMSVYGIEEMSGLQMIGWDPTEKKIRSWVYDSDGGFGSGLWSKQGDSWNVIINFTLSDGQKGVLTNVYTPRDGKSYTYSSIDRKIGDIKLPNIEPVTVVKEG